MCVKILNVQKLNAKLKLTTACLALSLLLPVIDVKAVTGSDGVGEETETLHSLPMKLGSIIKKVATHKAKEEDCNAIDVDLFGEKGRIKKEEKSNRGPKIRIIGDKNNLKNKNNLKDEDYKIVPKFQGRVLFMDSSKFRASPSPLTNLLTDYLDNKNTGTSVHRTNVASKRHSEDFSDETKKGKTIEINGELHADEEGPGSKAGFKTGFKTVASLENTKRYSTNDDKSEELKDSLEVAKLTQENMVRAGQLGQLITPYIDRNYYKGVVRLFSSVPKKYLHLFPGREIESFKIADVIKEFYDHKKKNGKAPTNFLVIDEDEPLDEYKKLIDARLAAKLIDTKAYDKNEYGDLNFYTLVAQTYFEKNKTENAEDESKLYYVVVNTKRNIVHFMQYGTSADQHIRNGTVYENN